MWWSDSNLGFVWITTTNPWLLRLPNCMENWEHPHPGMQIDISTSAIPLYPGAERDSVVDDRGGAYRGLFLPNRLLIFSAGRRDGLDAESHGRCIGIIWVSVFRRTPTPTITATING